ncbi:hypothetical protein D3C76_1788570 [compost metagenome]
MMYSFHTVKAFMIPTVIKPGFDNGNMILKKTPYSEDPSIVAASSSSRGSALKNPTRKKIPNGRMPIVPTE